MIKIDNLFSNAFSRNSLYLETGIKNGSRTRSKDCLSKLNTTGIATICGLFVNLCGMVLDNKIKFFEKDFKIYTECQSTSDSKKKYHILFDKMTNELKYFVTINDVYTTIDFGTTPHWSLFSPLFYMLKNDMTYGIDFSDAIKYLTIDFEGKRKFGNSSSLFKYCDYMYKGDFIYTNYAVEEQFSTSDMVTSGTMPMPAAAFSSTIPVIPITPVAPSSSKPKIEKKKEVVTFKGNELEWNRELTEDEKLRIPKFELNVDILVPDYVLPCINVIAGQHKSIYPIRNILLYGEAAAGKSTSSRIFAQLLGLPYYSFDISKNVDETILTAGAEVEKGTLTYNYSEVVQAVENGGLLELREIYTMAPGVQIFLNGLLEEGILRLPNGKLIKRHPNCIIVGTTNIDYEACQNFDKSTDDRFQIQYRVEPMPKEQILKVIMYKSGNKDAVLVGKLYDVYLQLRAAIEKEMMDSVATMRKLIEWAIHCKYMDTVTASKMTILSGITKDKREQENFLKKIILTTFK